MLRLPNCDAEKLTIHDLAVFETTYVVLPAEGSTLISLGEHDIDSHHTNFHNSKSICFTVQLSGEDPSVPFDNCDVRKLFRTLDSVHRFQSYNPSLTAVVHFLM